MAQTKLVFYERNLDVWQRRPELAGYIATITQLWSAIEHELALIFVILNGSHLALGRVFHDTVGIRTKLKMLKTLVRAYLPEDTKRYDALEERVGNTAKARNKIVHGQWSIREDKPDQVFLTLFFPITMDEAKPVAYTRKKFVDTANNLMALHTEVATFREHVLTLSQEQPFPRRNLLRK